MFGNKIPMSCCTDAGGLEAGLAKTVLLADRKVNLKGFENFHLKGKARIWPWHICVRAARPWGGVRCGAGADCSSMKYQYFGLLMYEARKQGSRSQCSSKARLLPPTAGSSARALSARCLSLSLDLDLSHTHPYTQSYLPVPTAVWVIDQASQCRARGWGCCCRAKREQLHRF